MYFFFILTRKIKGDKFVNNYQILQLIGKGSLAKVKLCKEIKTGQFFVFSL